MTSAIVLPSLTKWTESHISAILKATTPADLDAAFDAFLSEKASVTVNGVHFSRDKYKNFLQGKKFDEVNATVQFNGEVEVPSDSANPIAAGSVGFFYTSVITEGIVVRDAPVQTKFISSLHVFIDQDPSLPAPPPSPIHGFSDRRRVMDLNQVIAIRPVTSA